MLTVVIPTRNRQKELISLLEYLKSQVIVNEIIIVDSSDQKNLNTRDLDNNVKYIYTEIKSAAIQRNIGISTVKEKCDYVAFLDDDVLPPQNYFSKLIDSMELTNAIGVSGIAVNKKKETSKNQNELAYFLRRIFMLDSSKKGVVLKSGVNTAVDMKIKNKELVQAEWLIGCAIWDFHKIKSFRFNENFYGQSLGEDVLFSMRANKYGKLYVNTKVILNHYESVLERPNEYIFYRMWVNNRLYIIKELANTRTSIYFHWCNFGKILILLIKFFKAPKNSVLGLAGIFKGYLDLLGKNAN
jgi:glycosyltransferase involved in cell wall biosynthesis